MIGRIQVVANTTPQSTGPAYRAFIGSEPPAQSDGIFYHTIVRASEEYLAWASKYNAVVQLLFSRNIKNTQLSHSAVNYFQPVEFMLHVIKR